MPRLLILCHHRRDRSPGQRFRFEQYTAWLAEQGWQCTLSPLLNAWDDAAFYARGRWLAKLAVLARATARRLRDVGRVRQYDAVLVFREAHMLGGPFIERMIAWRGVPMLFDFDDAIWLPNVSEGNRALAFLKSFDKTRHIVAMSREVMAGNAYLADYARQYNPNVRIVPSTVDTEAYRPLARAHDPAAPVVIGWVGSPSTLPHFEVLEPVLARLQAVYGPRIRLRVVGDPSYRSAALQLQGEAWSAARELADLQSLDIGLMPLPDDPWTRGKCGMKGLLYMSVGVATVMSPVGVNRDIIQHGENGFLASTDAEWEAALRQLIDDAALRQRLGAAGRQTVVDAYSVQANRPHYLAALNAAIAPREGTTPSGASASR